ncbi:peptide chain release factor family protein [Zavarzinella formosa]|uniref:peptide chain release factor family protein n=1 Tax=Zavarzinella formosa TaxID=360055 RepID=UPI0002E19CBE|nr:peptide chain release factor-like protein [Zavarzinella formosa]
MTNEDIIEVTKEPEPENSGSSVSHSESRLPNLRRTWTTLSPENLLAQCEVDTYRASGPGGQKRNKTSSAVRLRHIPSGLLVIAEESRSQHENKAKALKRIWQAFFLELREDLEVAALTPEIVAEFPDYAEAKSKDGRLHLVAKDPRFWPAVGVALDVLAAVESRVSDAAKLLGISTGNLIDFLQTDPKVWQVANQLRTRHGQKPLR